MNILELSRWIDPEETGSMAELFRNAAAAARSRQFMQDLGVPVTKPIADACTRQQTDIFFHDARQGFLTSVRSNFPGAIQAFTEFNTETVFDGAISDELAAMGIEWKPSSLDLTSSPRCLAAYATTLTTLSILRQQRMVTYAQFKYRPDRLELGGHENAPSFWHQDLAPRVIWNTMSRLHQEAGTLLTGRDPIPDESLLFSGHFFTAALNLIKEIS